MECVNDRLWRIQKVIHRGSGGKHRLAVMTPYPGGRQSVELKEAWLLENMLPWEEAMAAKSRFLEKYWNQYVRGEWDHQQFPTFPQLAASLGFDPNTGCRVD